jgi:selenocysteine-specific elongation factor
MPVVGTAGHVDHGKSTLVRALTGRDPDRWEEEQRRGLTIDLGFAWCTLPGGADVGFVDVPGHERFIKNMLAGVEAIDVALFVVAADEGWMPQSEEHLQILDLLGIEHGLVALTRADLVPPDLLELAELEVRERIAGTFLEGAPVVAVGAPAQMGVAELADALSEVVAAAPARRGDRPRLWVDRAFTIGGAGTVVTGTLLDGPLAVGDSLSLWPGARPVRVRGLHRHEDPAERVEPGTRTAVNLAGIDHTEVERGMMLGRPGDWEPTDQFLADVRMVRSAVEAVRDRGAYHLHLGAGTRPARLRLLEPPVEHRPGAALVRTKGPLPLKAGDRFIVRDVGRRAVVAGGVVLDPHPPLRSSAARRALLALRASTGSADGWASALLRIRGSDSLTRLAADSGGGRPEADLLAGDVAVSEEAVERLVKQAAAALAGYHGRHPLRPGMPKAELASTLGTGQSVLEALVAARPHELTMSGPVVRLASFTPELDDAAEERWERARRQLNDAGPAAPRRNELGLDTEQVYALLREGRLVAVSDDLAYLPETLDDVRRTIVQLPDGFTVADFRDVMGVTRRHAVPLLEWADRSGLTRRVGEGRTVRRSRPDGPAPDAAPSL